MKGAGLLRSQAYETLLIGCISRYVEHRLAIDLKCDRTVESYRDPVPRLNLNDLLVINMLTLENGREDCECPDLAAAVEQEK